MSNWNLRPSTLLMIFILLFLAACTQQSDSDQLEPRTGAEELPEITFLVPKDLFENEIWAASLECDEETLICVAEERMLLALDYTILSYAWHPSGDQLLFSGITSVNRTPQVYLFDSISGVTAVSKENSAYSDQPIWELNGDRLAYSRCWEIYGCELVIVELESMEEEIVLESGNGLIRTIHYVDSLVYFMGYDEQGAIQLFSFNLLTDRQRQITRGFPHPWVTMHLGNEKIVYAESSLIPNSHFEEQTQLFLLQREERYLLVTEKGYLTQPDFSVSGRWLLYSVLSGDFEYRLLDMESGSIYTLDLGVAENVELVHWYYTTD